MEFTTPDGRTISEEEIREMVFMFVTNLKKYYYTTINYWEIKFLEWYLDKEIECNKLSTFEKPSLYLFLYENITENELEQLKRLKDYLEL